MGILSTLGKVASTAAKAYASVKKKNNTSSSSSTKSSSSNKTSSYVPKGTNTDDYIKQSNSNDYNAIQAYKQAYADAQARGDAQGMADANAGANAIRAGYGYSGGSDGSEYIVTSTQKVETNPYEDAMKDMQDRYDTLAKQQQEANRLAVNQGVQRLENQKYNVNQSYDDSARQAYIANMQTKKNLPQQLAASGINGGAAETTNLGVQTAYENNLNNINMNRNNSINDIDNAIIELKNNGDLAAVEQALASSQTALDSYKTLLGSKINYDINKKENDFNAQLSTINQYYDDFQAEIDRRMAINPNDPLIPYLQAARQEKINAQEQARKEAEKEAEQLAWDRYIQETELNNATLLNNANIANKNASTDNYLDQIAKRGQDGDKPIEYDLDYYTTLLENEGLIDGETGIFIGSQEKSNIDGYTQGQVDLINMVAEFMSGGMSEQKGRTILAKAGFNSKQINDVFTKE